MWLGANESRDLWKERKDDDTGECVGSGDGVAGTVRDDGGFGLS